jgi:hypothetical protein
VERFGAMAAQLISASEQYKIPFVDFTMLALFSGNQGKITGEAKMSRDEQPIVDEERANRR